MNNHLNILTFIFTIVFTIPLFSNVTMPEIFSDHMVLQRDANVNLWGWAKPNETVVITTSWSDEVYEYKTGGQGIWEIAVETNNTRGAQSVTVRGYNTIIFEDVLLGEVWLASGQSNMEWSPNAGIDGKEEAIAGANYPKIRFFEVLHASSHYPQDRLEGKWEVCTPETMGNFSAIAYFFAQKLHGELDVPVGVINSSWGGTPAESWTDEHSITLDRKLAHASTYQKEVPWGPHQPGRIYNAMINPLIPYTLTGVLWYQGESNVVYPTTYGRLLNTMVESWRDSWGIDFTFLYVQIAPYKYGRKSEGVLLREAQRTADIDNSEMIAINDIGNVNDIHPKNKTDVGVRLANVVLQKVYRQDIKPANGPSLIDLKIEGEKVVLNFKNVGSGLSVKEGSNGDFLVAGDDGVFKNAIMTIKKDKIELHSEGVDKPVAVRHAWSNILEASIFNSAGLPLSSFRTDDWHIDGF